eukprot:scaffold188024_cov20-Tisochrysis_lutea.AAC.2
MAFMLPLCVPCLADQFPELMGADNIGNQDEAEEGEYADSLRIPTPSSEASTSGSDPDGDKYPPQPERGYHAHELFDKAALEEVADYLRESEKRRSGMLLFSTVHTCWSDWSK